MDNYNLENDKRWGRELKRLKSQNNYFSKKISDKWGPKIFHRKFHIILKNRENDKPQLRNENLSLKKFFA